MDTDIQELKKQLQALLDDKQKLVESDNKESLFYIDRKYEILLEKLQNLLYNKFNKKLNNDVESDNECEVDEEGSDDDIDEAMQNIEISESSYTQIDEYPSMLFFHESIIKKYGICPFLKSTDSYNNVKEQIHHWLRNKDDKGKLFYDLHDKIINEKEIKQLSKKKSLLEDEIQVIINTILDAEHKNLYNDALFLLDEYTSSKLKTKKMKEKYKNIIYLFSEIYNNCHIAIHEYISEKLKLDIPINYTTHFDNNEQIRLLREHFKDYIEKYKNHNAEMEHHVKVIKNMKKNLLDALNLYLNTTEPDIYKQEGKYFKKWSLLNAKEHLDRLESFSKYYISKKMNNKQDENYVNLKKEDDVVLFNFLKDVYTSKNLKFNYFKWDVKKGIIESFPYLLMEFKNDSVSFSLKIKPAAKPKSTILKTIFSKENEQKINEFILTYILKNKNENEINKNENKSKNEEINEKFKELCFENIKLKLNLKKISKSDMIVLDKKFDDIYNIINKKQRLV